MRRVATAAAIGAGVGAVVGLALHRKGKAKKMAVPGRHNPVPSSGVNREECPPELVPLVQAVRRVGG